MSPVEKKQKYNIFDCEGPFMVAHKCFNKGVLFKCYLFSFPFCQFTSLYSLWGHLGHCPKCFHQNLTKLLNLNLMFMNISDFTHIEFDIKHLKQKVLNISPFYRWSLNILGLTSNISAKIKASNQFFYRWSLNQLPSAVG